MKRFYLLVLIIFSAYLANAQSPLFKARIDELYSGANADQPTWKFWTRPSSGDHDILNECWGADNFPVTYRWFSTEMYNFTSEKPYDTDPNYSYRLIRNRNTPLGTVFKFLFQGYDHDEHGRCAKQDDEVCGWSSWDDSRYWFTVSYDNLGNTAPGGWKQVEYNFCDMYRARISYLIQPPTVRNNYILLSKNGVNAETNYCQGSDIVLKVTDTAPGVIEHQDLEYVWEYNLNDEGEWDWNTCLRYEWYPGCGNQGEIADDCTYCAEYMWNATWRTATVTTSKTAYFTLPYKGSYKFRVYLRHKTNRTDGYMGYPSLETPAIQVYDPAPILADIPTDGDLTIDNAPELDYSSSSISLHHVSCRGASTGTISIKSVSGGGSYYYTLRKNDGTLTMNINGNTTGAPTASRPVVFPANSFNAGGLTGLPAGSYTLIIENYDDPNGVGDNQRLCYNSYTIYIKQPAAKVTGGFAPVAQGNGNPYPISCYGMSDGIVSTTGTGGIGPYTYSLSGFSNQSSSGAVNFTGLSASGSYSLVVRDAFSCASDAVTVQNLKQPAQLIVQPPQPEFFGDQNQYNISCYGGDGQLTIFTTGDAALTRKVQIVGGEADNDVANDLDAAILKTKAGERSIVASYQFGCTTDPVKITLAEPSILKADILDAQAASCLPGQGTNDSDGYLTLKISGGIPKAPDQYKTYVTAYPQTILPGTEPSFPDMPSGNYTVMVQDSYCNTQQSDIVIPDNPHPVSFMGLAVITDPSCNQYDDGKINVTGKGGFPFNAQLYEFYINGVKKTGQHTTTTFDQGITTGGYTLTIRDSRGCRADTVVSVGEPLALTGLLTVTPNQCRDEQGGKISATLSGGTGPYTVQWLAGDGSNAVIKSETEVYATEITNQFAGDYTLQMKDSRGCTNKMTDWYSIPKSIVDPEVLVLSVFSVQHISCFGYDDGYVSLAAKGGWSGYQYSWDNQTFKTSNEFKDLKPGVNEFFVRDARGCVRSTSQLVEEPEVLQASVLSQNNVQCFGLRNGSIQALIEGGTSPYYVKAENQDWKQGIETTGLGAGTHTVEIKDSNGCPQSIEATLTQPDKLVLSRIGTTSSTCGEKNGDGTVAAVGGVEPYEYRWYNSAGELAATGATGSNLSSDNYHVEVEDNNQCITPLSVAISDVGGAKIDTWDITRATCSYSQDGAIDITITEGTAPFQVSWSNKEKTEDIEMLAAGDYQVLVQDANDCKLFKTLTVPAPEQLDVTLVASQPPTCFGDNDAFFEIDFKGGNGGYTYEWTDGRTGKRQENLTAGSYTIKLEDSEGCAYQETILVEDPAKLTLGLEDKTICVGQIQNIILPVQGGTYRWTSTNGFESDQREVALSVPSVYSVHVVDIKGCIAEESFELKTSTDLLNAELLMAREAYAGDTVVVIDISWPMPDGISWQFDLSTSEVIYQDQNYAELIFSEPGTYAVSVEAALGECRDLNTQYITINAAKEETTNGRVETSSVIDFQIHPNPNGGDFVIRFALARSLPARIRMLNLAGNSAFIDKRMNDVTNYEYNASLPGVPAGVYFVVLEVAGETITKRVVIR